METTNQEINKCSTYDELEKKLTKLSERLKTQKEPVFIELIGTPKSGKTTLKKAFSTCFQNFGINTLTRKETAEYNPISKKSDNYNMWMILELFKNVSEDLSNNSGKIIIYDRGILDRLPWMRLAQSENEISKDDFTSILSLYEISNFKKYKPISLILETSPELSVKRKGKPGGCVNVENMEKFNDFLLRSKMNIEGLSSTSHYIHTDEYQGKLKDFILVCTYNIIDSINKELDARENQLEEK